MSEDERADEPAPSPGADPAPYRLDPDRALADRALADRALADRAGAEDALRPPPRRMPDPVIDTRRYRWTIGGFGIALLIAFSVYMFTTRGVQTTGVPAGQALHRFVAPLASSDLNGDANVNPRCNPAHPNLRALNVCGRAPIVLALFATGSGTCVHAVDTLQQVADRFPGRGITFAAVAVQASHSQTAALVRAHRWTIPVAYDADGAVGQLYGVDICPMFELARAGGVVAARLIGEHWLSAPTLAAQVTAAFGSHS